MRERADRTRRLGFRTRLQPVSSLTVSAAYAPTRRADLANQGQPPNLYRNLANATHTLTITVLGQASPFATANRVYLDYVDAWDGAPLPNGICIWTCTSIAPGVTSLPVASSVRVPVKF